MTVLPRRALSDAERIDWLRLSHTTNVGPITFFSLLERYGSAGAAIADLPRLAEKLAEHARFQFRQRRT